MYIHLFVMQEKLQGVLPDLPCACASLRRAARAATRMYDRELRASELELSQFTLLMALDLTGEITQKGLGKLLAMDSTTLTRTLSFLIERGWIGVNPGTDRREKLLSLTRAGREKFAQAQPDWERAQKNLKANIGEEAWNEMGQLLANIASRSEQS
jgi:DNA-binding MarR family transcriptional regulator